MTSRHPLSPATIVSGLIVTIVGGIVVAMLVGEGRFAPSPSIDITLTNHHCEALDYYVDGQLTVSALAPGATAVFQTTRGQHSIQLCIPGTDNCTEGSQSWRRSTTDSITRGTTCLIEITLTNDHCKALDYYVDERLVVSVLGAGSTATFETTPGEHSIRLCIPGTGNCTEGTSTWQTSTTQAISRGSDCP